MRKFIFLLTVLFAPLLAQNAYTAKDYSHLIGMPGFSDSLLQMHFKLYEGYVKNANDLLSKLKAMTDTTVYEFGALKNRQAGAY